MFIKWSLDTFSKLFPPATVLMPTNFIQIARISIFTERWIILA